MDKKPLLKTYRLVLKSIEDKDKESLIKMAKDPKIKKTYMLPDFSSVEQETTFFEKIKNLTNCGSGLLYRFR